MNKSCKTEFNVLLQISKWYTLPVVAVNFSVEDKEEALVETDEVPVSVETSVATLVGVSDVEATVVSVVSVLDTSTGAKYTLED